MTATSDEPVASHLWDQQTLDTFLRGHHGLRRKSRVVSPLRQPAREPRRPSLHFTEAGVDYIVELRGFGDLVFHTPWNDRPEAV